MNKLFATALVAALMCGISGMANAQGDSLGEKMVPKPDVAGSTVIKDPPTIQDGQPDGSQQQNLDEVRAKEAEELKKLQAKPATAQTASAPTTMSAADQDFLAKDLAVKQAIAAATTAVAEAENQKGANGTGQAAKTAIAKAEALKVQALKAQAQASPAALALAAKQNATSGPVSTSAPVVQTKVAATTTCVWGAQFTPEQCDAMTAMQLKQATAAKSASAATPVVVQVTPSTPAPAVAKANLPVVPNAQKVRPTKGNHNAEWMREHGYIDNPVRQADGRVRRDWGCWGEKTVVEENGEKVTVCKQTAVSVVMIGDPDEGDE